MYVGLQIFTKGVIFFRGESFGPYEAVIGESFYAMNHPLFQNTKTFKLIPIRPYKVFITYPEINACV